MADRPVRESIREIDGNSWLIGNKLLLSRASLSECTWGDGNGGGYSISDAPLPLPESRPLSDTSDIKLVYDGNDARGSLPSSALAMPSVKSGFWMCQT
ncbi:hypothetical protein B0T10DRAFT_494862 [Thelonectria olida]|uniref:Uncharacterized protein n=1 Tax=Thelonectria olida TaxID=1576542 RepID=A0A9P8VZJ9_9HYPO|nr:hypothetical protein B0T10DRAFT_494862 [Thelonectria olida]